MKTTKTILACMLAAVFGLTSCQKESIDPGFSGGEVEVTLVTDVAGVAESQARALTYEEEAKVSTAKILVFRQSNSQLVEIRDGKIGTMNYTGNTDVHNNTGEGKTSISFTAFKTDYEVYFVVIANAKTQVEAMSLTAGTSKSTMKSHSALRILSATATTHWPNNTVIPMYGETDNTPGVKITDGLATTPISISLGRMLARINVRNSVAAATFTLTSVSLYDYNNSGYIAPDQTPLVGTATTAYAPASSWNVPRDATVTTTTPHLNFTTTSNAITKQIYTFERKSAGYNPTTLVIGGRYNGSSTVTYYKLEIKYDTNVTDIKRNHSYDVNITSVTGPGYPDEPPVFNSATVNLAATITAWVQKTIPANLEGPIQP